MGEGARRFLGLMSVCVAVGFGCAYDIPYDDSGNESPTPSGDPTSPTPTVQPTPPGAQVVYATDFENDNGGFTVVDQNGNSSWEWGEPTNGPGGAASGLNVWATNLNGRYQDFDDSCAQSPDIPLPPSGSLELRYQLAVETEQGYDYWRVEVGGVGPNPDQLDGGSGGNSNDYKLEIFELNVFAGMTVHINFCLETDDGVRDDGLYVDDVMVLVY